MMLRFLALLAMVLVSGQCAYLPRAGRAAAGPDRNVVFTPEDWPLPVRAELFRPERVDGPAPAVVLIHGGGLKLDDLRWQMRGIARKLSARGYFVMSVTYRGPPRWQYPAPMDDIRAAVDWLHTNADEQGIDPARIATFGYSAGGHLALLHGLRDPRVKAIVAGAAPSDLMLFEGGRLVQEFLDGTRAEQPERYRLASPLYQVHESSPPVFLYHGRHDEMVPPIHSWIMKCELDAAGVVNELHWLEGKGHVGAFLWGGPAEDKAIDFLDRVFEQSGALSRPSLSRGSPAPRGAGRSAKTITTARR